MNNCKIVDKVSRSNFVKNLQWLILVPIFIFLVGTLFYAVWGLNLSSDLQNQYTFAVDYKTTVCDEDFNSYQSTISNLAKNNGLSEIYFDKLGVVTNTMLNVRIVNDEGYSDSELDSKLTALIDDIQNEYSSIDTIGTYDVEYPDYINVLTPIWVLLIAMAIIFVWLWIRYELVTAYSNLMGSLLTILLTLGLLLICRIPFGKEFALTFFGSMLISNIIFIVFADRIRGQHLKYENPKITNAEYVSNSLSRSLPTISLISVILIGLIIIASILLLIMKNFDLLFSLINVAIAIVVGLYVGVFVSNSIWARTYKLENDKKLTARIEKLKTKDEQKATKKKVNEDDDKIVV